MKGPSGIRWPGSSVRDDRVCRESDDMVALKWCVRNIQDTPYPFRGTPKRDSIASFVLFGRRSPLVPVAAGGFSIVGNPLIAFEGLGCSVDDVDVAVRARFECQESVLADDPDVFGGFVGHF